MTSEYKEAEEPPPPPPERPTAAVDDGWGEDPQRRPRRRTEALMQELNDQAPYEATPTSTDGPPRSDVHDGWGEDPKRRESRRTAGIAQHADDSRISESPSPTPLTPEATEPEAGSEEDEPGRDRVGRKGPEFSTELRYKPKVEGSVDDEWAQDEEVEVPHEEAEPHQAAEKSAEPSSDRTSREGGLDTERDAQISAARDEVERAYDSPSRDLGPLPVLPVSPEDITARSTDNRIDLADNVHDSVEKKQTYGGYLDVVMHGNEFGTQADINGERRDFTLEETAQLIEASSEWRDRPIRLLSCNTGAGDYAQALSDRLGVPVYAPSRLSIRPW